MHWTVLAVTASLVGLCAASATADSVDIGSRLELLVDNHLIDRLDNAELVLHRPTEREVVLVLDKPWEGNNCGYVTVFQDGDLYRMYYRGRQLHWESGKVEFPHEQVFCYAESRDGVHWDKPELGLIEFQGLKANNIILKDLAGDNFSPFLDSNPDCKPEEKYKGLGHGKGGMLAFRSSDGIRWELVSDKPVITKGAFDSQNIAFWDDDRGEYREYHRAFREGRDIMTSTSKDFLTWTEPVWLEYSPDRRTQLYTNQIAPYYRAPHLLLGFPTRYIDGRSCLTPLNEAIAKVNKRFGIDYTDGGFMTSRDRVRFDVWGEAFIRPGPEHRGRWAYGDNYQNWGIIETPVEGADTAKELSVYASEGCWSGTSMALRRYTLRLDGFVSAMARADGGEVVTKPVQFAGKELVLNFATSAAGSVRVELQDEQGAPLDGFALGDCIDLFGDSTERVVSWKGGTDVSALAGKPVRLRFVLRDADLFAFRFR